MGSKVKLEYEFEKAKVKQALRCLRELHENKSENADKPKLFDEAKDEPVALHFTIKKIPELKSFQRIRVRLPHSYLKEDADVCLITGDLDRRDRKADIEPTVLHYKDMLNKLDINNVTEVVPLRQLRTEYQSFESLRQLAGQYDVFLSDHKIHQCLSKLLGSTFIKCQKFPIQLDLKSTKLKNLVDQAISGTVFYVTGRGSMCGAQVAHLGLKDIQIIKNVRAVVETLAARIPGGWKNIDTIYLQTPRSVSIPIYMSFDLQKDIEIKVPKPMEIDFLSSVNEYIRQQEEDSPSDSEDETGAKEIEKKRMKVGNDEESADEVQEAQELKDVQNKVLKPKKRKISSLDEYIKKLQGDFLSDDEKETKKRKVENDSHKDSEESADEVQEKSKLRRIVEEIKGKKTETKKIAKREKVENDEASEESADEVQEKSELSTAKKIKGKKTKTKKIVKKRSKFENDEDEANEASENDVQQRSKFQKKTSTEKKLKVTKSKTKKIERVQNEANEESAGEVQEKTELKRAEKKNKRNRQSNKKMAKANVEQAQKINNTKNKNKNEKSIVTKQKKKKNVKISAA